MEDRRFSVRLPKVGERQRHSGAGRGSHDLGPDSARHGCVRQEQLVSNEGGTIRALVEVADIEEQKQLEWTGRKERTSLIRLSAKGASAGGAASAGERNLELPLHARRALRKGEAIPGLSVAHAAPA